MAGHRAAHGPAVPAGRVLVAEQRDRHAIGSPAGRRHDRGEERDDRGPDGGGEMGDAGVGDQDRVRAGQHGGELGQAGASAQVGHLATAGSPGCRRGQVPLARATG